MLGNVPLVRVREQELLSHITLVSHDSYLFKGTVEDNLRMASSKASEQVITDALKKVNPWEFLKSRGGLYKNYKFNIIQC